MDGIACLRGTRSAYEELYDIVVVEKLDGRVMVVNLDIFDQLYQRLDDFTAALKEDCIEFVVYDIDKPVCEYPDWFIMAVNEGYIWNDSGTDLMYDECCEIPLDNYSIVLRNFMGHLRHMYKVDFMTYYESDFDRR